MSPRVRAVDPGRLVRWCREHLGSPPAGELFRSGYLSAVIGLRLADGREVVVKVRPASPRIAACVEVQRRMFQAGYRCPRPLTGAAPFGGDVATAEAYVPGGAVFPSGDHSARPFAEAFVWLIRLAPRPAEVLRLDPAPSWAAWNHAGDGLWPYREDLDVSLNEVAGPEWIDDAGRRARDRLRAGGSEAVIGHCDWLAGNLRWSGDELLVVHDWDSVTADSEAVLAGFAAALYPAGSAGELATVEDTERFLVAYCHARGQAGASSLYDDAGEGPGEALWVLFPEANRDDVLRLLSMLLERLSAPAAPSAVEGDGVSTVLTHEHADGKVQGWHRDRLAVVYVRQSSRQQVAEHGESTRLQYGLVDRAVALGRPACRVMVIDEDLGRSAANAAERPGFARLVAEITMGHVGLVLGLEM